MDEITIEEIYRNITKIIEKIDIIESKIDSIYESRYNYYGYCL